MVQTNAKPVTLNVPADVHAAIAETTQRSGRSFEAVANELLAEVVKTRRVPGIVFVDGVHGREPVVAGTGLQVFEIISAYRNVDNDWARLVMSFHWLADWQLKAALEYAETYPEELEARFRQAEEWTVQRLWEECPITRPPHR
jgi:uncharacterized protein (DUF433 family)